MAPEISGLTPAEVEARAADGLVNSYGGPTTKSVGQIVCEHFFTLFNGVNAVLALSRSRAPGETSHISS